MDDAVKHVYTKLQRRHSSHPTIVDVGHFRTHLLPTSLKPPALYIGSRLTGKHFDKSVRGQDDASSELKQMLKEQKQDHELNLSRHMRQLHNEATGRHIRHLDYGLSWNLSHW